jgi:predicted transcriptional regulator
MKLVLTDEERELLEQILEHRRLELQKEIAHTYHREFKQMLRDNEKLISDRFPAGTVIGLAQER